MMRLSRKTIEFCGFKCGKKELCGFHPMDAMDVKGLSEEDAKKIIDELQNSELVAETEEEIHLNALGQCIISMIAEPEQYLTIDNEKSHKSISVYFRNAYYLCILENKDNTADGLEALNIELLPGLKLVIGAFAYAIKPVEDHHESGTDLLHGNNEIRVMGKSFDKDGKCKSEIRMDADWKGQKIHTKLEKDYDGVKGIMEMMECEESDFVNTITTWIFEQISESKEVS